MARTNDKNYLEDLFQTEIKIMNVLQKLEELEQRKGINSSIYESVCRLLQDFLDEENAYVSMIIKNPNLFDYILTVLSDKEIINLDEALFASIFEIEDSILYRMNALFNARDPHTGKFDKTFAINVNIAEIINVDLLKNTSDPKLKYKLAFVNPTFSRGMAINYFASEMLCPEIDTVLLKNEPFYGVKRTNYLLKRFTEVFGFIVLNSNAKNDNYFNLLLSINKLIPEEIRNQAISTLLDNGFSFEKLNEVYTILRNKEKEQNYRKNLTNI